MSTLAKTIESLLFIFGEPVAISRLTALTGAAENEVKNAVEEIEEALTERGIRLLSSRGSVCLVTAPESAAVVGTIMKEELSGDLSKAAAETLAIIVYKGPIARSDIDYIRGVNSSFTLRNLLIRGLAERVPHPKDARTFLYKPSIELLKLFGISNIEEIPEYKAFQEQMNIQEEKEEES